MSKKILALLTAAVVMVAGTVTAFAAPSPSTTTTTQPDAGQVATTTVDIQVSAAADAAATAADGFTVTAVSDSTYSSVATAVQNNILNHLVAVGNATGNTTVVNAAYDVNSTVTASVVSVVDVAPASATKGADGYYTVTITNSDIVAGGTYVILHWNGSVWETIYPTSVTTGAATFKTASCSPFAVIRLNTATNNNAPKTGETFPVCAAVALTSLVGAVVCGKKYFA